MGRNEIRLRRQQMTSGRIARHRNFGDLLSRHEREQRMKKMMRMVVYFLIIAFFLIIFMIVIRWERREQIREQNQLPVQTSRLTTAQAESSHHRAPHL